MLFRRVALFVVMLIELAQVIAAPSAADAPIKCANDSLSSPITVVLHASRLSGVAPLSVFFDARDTSAERTIRPFHDLEFRWNFGDPSGGSWANGSRSENSSRNLATGAVAAHLYERPGIFQVTMAVTDGRETVRYDCIEVTVFDPDAFFFGERTVCLSNIGDFDACPTGAQQVVEPTKNFAIALAKHAGPGRRLLFRRDETWQSPTAGILRTTGPGILGAFGKGANPKIQASANSDAPIIQLSSPTTPAIRDWRVIDLELDGNGNASRHAIKAEGGINQLSLLRLNIHHVRNGLLLSNSLLDWHNKNPRSAGHTLWDQIALVDSTTSNVLGSGGAYSVYASASRFMLLGNNLNNDGGGEHTVRLPSIVAGVISNNTIGGQGNTAGGKHAFTLRAAIHGSGGVEGGQDTRWIVVSDNIFRGRSGSDWTVTYQPQSSADERVTDVITERNWFLAGGGVSGTQFALALFARDQTIRNNLFDTSGGRAHGGILVHDGLSVGSKQIRIYNNSFLSRDPGKDFVGIYVRPGADYVSVHNNLAYAPLDSRAIMFTGTATASHNSSNTQVRSSSPLFGADASTSPSAWRPGKGSYAIGSGTEVPVWSDYFGRNRPPHHLGAALP